MCVDTQVKHTHGGHMTTCRPLEGVLISLSFLRYNFAGYQILRHQFAFGFDTIEPRSSEFLKTWKYEILTPSF